MGDCGTPRGEFYKKAVPEGDMPDGYFDAMIYSRMGAGRDPNSVQSMLFKNGAGKIVGMTWPWEPQEY